jgi:hypothetical protein
VNALTSKLIHGRWVPAIPEPYPLLVRHRCSCGRKFWTREGYDAHYAFAHILYASPRAVASSREAGE